jgi:hypothetical protein
MRADHHGAPRLGPAERSRGFLEPALLAQLVPRPAPRTFTPGPDAPPEGLRVNNQSAARAIVGLNGVAIGWVDAGEAALFVGLRRGGYNLFAIRPYGNPVLPSRKVTLPGVLTIP